MKVGTWNGCRDCPYVRKLRKEGHLDIIHCKDLDINIALMPNSPYPTICKIPDLPTQEDVLLNSYDCAERLNFEANGVEAGFVEGGTFILNAIKK